MVKGEVPLRGRLGRGLDPAGRVESWLAGNVEQQ